ncbi:CitMHS family transporter [Anaerosalibacter massiliensis]|uniref:Citrate:proton symporter n=1 Tax=Anaerosalibacter massiliensis TaxID=1347392 RepID=A0A9X2MKV5_9FIRM|nr:citrate:proton symporter [Anaerosalibacter massiliensis]MCR2045383.1 citrate:proton symporter [Anaerosalibacter massiliensis]
MLAILGLLTIITLLLLIMSNRVSATVALIIVPIIFALVGGFGNQIGEFMIEGIKGIAPVGTMFIFAILFFGVLTDAGTFDPIINRILNKVGNDPVKIAIGTAILAMLVHLDGSGAVTFLVTIPAMIPLYDALGMNRHVLATITALSAGVMNILPWGGPTLRAATALEVSVTELFTPLLPAVIVGILFVIFVAYRIGKRERKRIGEIDTLKNISLDNGIDEDKKELARPKMFTINIVTIIVTIGVLISGILPPAAIFMIAFSFALIINYPKINDQKERVDAHAKEALMMASILFAAGAFTGILRESGMIQAMADATVSAIPKSLGRFIPMMVGIISMPASLLFDPDSFYFGILPVLSSTAEAFGVQGIGVGRAAILGQMTTGFPVSPLTGSTFLLIGLAKVDFGEHQKKTIPYAFLNTIIMLIVAFIVGAISI